MTGKLSRHGDFSVAIRPRESNLGHLLKVTVALQAFSAEVAPYVHQVDISGPGWQIL